MEITAIIEQIATGLGYFVAGIYVVIAFLFLFARTVRLFGLRFESHDRGIKGFLKNFH
jgi:hypothetical protein